MSDPMSSFADKLSGAWTTFGSFRFTTNELLCDRRAALRGHGRRLVVERDERVVGPRGVQRQAARVAVLTMSVLLADPPVTTRFV